MYYELYMDIFFLVNFIMDIFILSIAKKILKCPVTYGRISLGAAVGSGLTCIALLFSVKTSCIKFIIFYGVISILMTRTGLGIRFDRRFVQTFLVVYISALLIGGVFSSMEQYMRESVMFIVFAVVSYKLAVAIWKFVLSQGKVCNINCEVLLISEGNRIKVKAIIDTGNRLFDDITGKPVSIITRKTANKLWKELPKEGLRYIPYHTIEGKGGVLPLFVVEKICLYQERELWLSKIMVAVCDEDICKGEYEMILHSSVK